MKKNLTGKQLSDLKYEREQRGPMFIKIMLTKNDNQEEWKKIKKYLQNEYGSVKAGFYALCKKDKII